MAQYPNSTAGGGIWTLEKQRTFAMGQNWISLNSNYDSIASHTVGATNQGTITFSSIPQTYKHLQIRAITRTNRASTYDATMIYINGDTTQTNYWWFNTQGTGTTASSSTFNYNGVDSLGLGNSTTSTYFATEIIDILHYTNTNIKKSLRTISGFSINGVSNSQVGFSSTFWNNTSAITSLAFYPNNTPFTWAQHTSFALYGIS